MFSYLYLVSSGNIFSVILLLTGNAPHRGLFQGGNDPSQEYQYVRFRQSKVEGYSLLLFLENFIQKTKRKTFQRSCFCCRKTSFTGIIEVGYSLKFRFNELDQKHCLQFFLNILDSCYYLIQFEAKNMMTCMSILLLFKAQILFILEFCFVSSMLHPQSLHHRTNVHFIFLFIL